MEAAEAMNWQSILDVKRARLHVVDAERTSLRIEVAGVERILDELEKGATTDDAQIRPRCIPIPAVDLQVDLLPPVHPRMIAEAVAEAIVESTRAGSLKERILAWVGLQTQPVGSKEVAAALDLEPKKASIALCQYAKAGHLRRVGEGRYLRAGRKLAGDVIDWSAPAVTVGHDFYRIGTIHACRKCPEKHGGQHDFGVRCGGDNA